MQHSRQSWLEAFVSALLAIKPSLSGRVDLHSARFLMSCGLSPEDAAGRYIESCPWAPSHY
jgi:hypothetical protein